MSNAVHASAVVSSSCMWTRQQSHRDAFRFPLTADFQLWIAVPWHITDSHDRISRLCPHMCSIQTCTDAVFALVCRNIGLSRVLKRGIRRVVAYCNAFRIKNRFHVGNPRLTALFLHVELHISSRNSQFLINIKTWIWFKCKKCGQMSMWFKQINCMGGGILQFKYKIAHRLELEKKGVLGCYVI